MCRARRLLLVCVLLLGGCRGGPVVQETDRILLEMASHPFDVAPPQPPELKPNAAQRAGSVSDGKSSVANASGSSKPVEGKEAIASTSGSLPEADIHTVAFLQPDKRALSESELKIPPGLPGSEAPALPVLPKDPEERKRAVQKLYPEMPPLPPEPAAEPGPSGVAYTLADLQKLAVENSPTLRAAVAGVKEAEGNLVQARTYSNPTIAPFYLQPNNNNAAAGAPGVFLEQPISTFGKKKMQVAVAQKQLDNAQLALKRARFDLTTNVRNAYFALIVARETMRIDAALVRFSDEIYRLYADFLARGVAASFEPAPLRAQAWANRLIYIQARNNYVSAWQQLIAFIGLEHMPLTEVSGSIDRLIPYYDYDKVLSYILSNHTDVLTARNGMQIAQYNLTLAQITPFGDFNLQYGVNKEVTVAPFLYYNTFMVGMPLPIFDQNRGNIKAAQAQLIRAVEESHRVENVLTGSLASNYANYKNNLSALEYYRRHILPDQVTYYRGVFERRSTVSNLNDLSDVTTQLVAAQQVLTLNVQNYLGVLGTLWSSVVSVADLIQTPDLFQLAQPHELPPVPKLDQIPHWLCPHHRVAAAAASMMDCNCPPPVAPIANLPPARAVTPTPTQPTDRDPVLPAPRPSDKPSTLPPPSEQPHKQAKRPDVRQELLEPPPEIPKTMKRNEQGEAATH